MADDLTPAARDDALRDSAAEARELADDLDAVTEAATRSREAAGALAGELNRAGGAVGRGLNGPQGLGAAEAALSRLTRRAETAGRGIANEIESGFKQAVRRASDALADGELDLGKLGRRFASDLAAGLAERAVDGSLFSGGGGGSASGFLSGVWGLFASVKHGGGVAGDGGGRARRVDSSIFAHAPRYHGGGVAGLSAGEVPAILQRGEAVFTPAQLRLLGETVGARGEGRAASGPPVNLTLNVSSADANGFRAAQGQILAEAGRMIQRHLRRNA